MLTKISSCIFSLAICLALTTSSVTAQDSNDAANPFGSARPAQDNPFAQPGDVTPNPFGNRNVEQPEPTVQQNRAVSGNSRTEEAGGEIPVTLLNVLEGDPSNVEDFLTKRISVSYNETPFAQVMRDISRTFQVTLILDPSASEHFLPDDEPISFRGSGTLKDILRTMLGPYEATYLVKNEFLVILSTEMANVPSFYRTEVIDCTELISLIRASDQYRIREPGSIETELESVILDHTGHDMWRDSKPRIIGQRLVIRHSEYAIDVVAELIAKLEKDLNK